MRYAADELSQLSALLDQGMDLPEAEREAWLAGLGGEAEPLRPALREMLAREASPAKPHILERPPAFTVPGGEGHASPFREGHAIGPYRLLRAIGLGGMGEVWLAERSDGQLKRRVALKLPMLSLRRSVLVQRFERERDILGALVHPNIARLYDAGLAEDGQPFLALEYVEGTPITEAANRMGLDARGRVSLLRQVMEAVQYAHANLVIHRDLKPGNVLVTPEGKAILLDFGIAKLVEDEAVAASETELTRIGGRALTPHYAAPELIAGLPISTAIDIWALGVLLFELLSGSRPFEAATRGTLEHKVLTAEPARPSQRRSGAMLRLSKDAAADLDTIVLKALKKDPAERYVTAGGFSADLEHWLQGRPVEAQPDSAWYRTRKFVGRYRKGVAAASFATIAIIAAASVAVVFGIQAQLESARALAARDFMIEIFLQTDPDMARGKDVTARQLLVQGYRTVVESMGEQPLLQAELLMGIGDALEAMEDTVSADKAYAQAALAYQRLGRPRDAAHATLDRAAMRFAYMWEVSSAADLTEQARKMHPDPDGDDELIARYGIHRAALAGLNANSREEKEWYGRARAPAERTFGENTSRAVMAVRYLASFEGKYGSTRSASDRLNALLERLKSDKRARPAWIVGVLDELGGIEFAAGRYRAAMERYDAEASYCRGSADPHGSQCVYNQFQRARMLLMMGRHESALDAVPALLSPRVGPNNARLATQFRLLAYHVLAMNGQLDRHPALAAEVDALADSMDEKGELWLDKAFLQMVQARMFLEQNRASEAHALSSRTRALVAARAADARPFSYAFVLDAMAAQGLGRAETALKVLDETYAGQVEMSGADHPMAQLVSVHRARPLWAMGERDKALGLLDHAIPILREALGPDAPNFLKLERLRDELATTTAGAPGAARKTDIFM